MRFGLPVRLVAGRPAVVCGGTIGAIGMPAELGARVLHLLSNQSGPVVTDPRGMIWTFLVAGVRPDPAARPGDDDHPASAATADRFGNHAVTVHPDGRSVLLPMSDTGFGWRWAREPRPGRLRLPNPVVVLDALVPALESDCAAVV
ncbi:hypothetical protein [Nocardia sp. alder85J]|uniref:hypothetical protein n=1 Tax=Nocardia sp. alder85J TaxID=2862949 RepID=UPI001CD6EB38|nr:hypothetical protein [Nocardia sp. alder85J]MCX4094381.1 hypothetical protein [Nocardia sp. alder85J]